VILVASLSACRPGPPPSGEARPTTEYDKRAIEALREKEVAAFNSGNVQGFIDIVTDDVVFDSPYRPAAIGKDAIRSLCEVVFERFDYDATYPTDELVVDRSWAFDRGTWIEKRTAKEGGEQTQVSFGILQVYRRQDDGSWKLARSIWNTK
jgi:ketosteroid isomerase-like protein